jgi:hypothetical protein
VEKLPNIVIIGRSSLGICDEITAIVTQLGIDPKDGVITYSPDICCISMMPDNHDSPYLIVRDTDPERCQRIAQALNKELNIDVEWQTIAGFIPKSEPNQD